MRQDADFAEISLLEPPVAPTGLIIYLSAGILLGIVILLLLESLEILFQILVEGVRQQTPVDFGRLGVILTFRRWVSVALTGVVFGSALGILFFRLKESHQSLKTFHSDFEPQVAALRHHYKNLAVGIQGFAKRVTKKAGEVYAKVHQEAQKNFVPPELLADCEALQRSAHLLDDTSLRLSQTLQKELRFLKALTAESPQLEHRDFYPFLVGCVKDLLELRFQDKEIAVEINGQPYEECQDSYEFAFEPYATEVICQNILSNAMTYGDHLTIAGQPEDGRFRLEIQDNGPGVAVEELKNSLYSQPEAAESESTKLGLKVTIHLLRKLDGDLRLKSAPGTGSTFILEILQG